MDDQDTTADAPRCAGPRRSTLAPAGYPGRPLALRREDLDRRPAPASSALATGADGTTTWSVNEI